MTDCAMCWDHDCSCGFSFLHYRQTEGLRDRALLLQDVADFIDEFGPFLGRVWEEREANFNKFKMWRKENRGR